MSAEKGIECGKMRLIYEDEPLECSTQYMKMLKLYCMGGIQKSMLVPHETDVLIKFGQERLYCKHEPLKCYSKYFKHQNESNPQQKEFDLTGKHITVEGFKQAYVWMVAENSKIDLDFLLPTLKVAEVLEIKKLKELCLRALHLHTDADALLLYLEARRLGGLSHIEQAMLMRTNNVFLLFVASAEFFDTPLAHLCTIIIRHAKKDSVCQAESLMSAVRWLNHEWPARRDHVMEVMECIHFNLLPIPLPYMLERAAKDCVQVSNVVKHEEVTDLIRMGMIIKLQAMQPEMDREHFAEKVIAKSSEAVKTMWRLALRNVGNKGDSIVEAEEYVMSYEAFEKYLDSLPAVSAH